MDYNSSAQSLFAECSHEGEFFTSLEQQRLMLELLQMSKTYGGAHLDLGALPLLPPLLTSMLHACRDGATSARPPPPSPVPRQADQGQGDQHDPPRALGHDG